MDPRKLLGLVGFVFGLAVGACGGEPSDSPASATTTPESVSVSTAPTTTSSTTTTIPPTTTTSAVAEVSIDIQGDTAFVDHTSATLELLRSGAPDWYAQVVDYIEVITSVKEGSGMMVESRTFLAGEQTAYAPGYEEADQRVWYASTMVHDACHSRLYATGEAHTGRDAELECLMNQVEALKLLDGVGFLTEYVQGLIDGVDDPGNDYWNNPDRHW